MNVEQKISREIQAALALRESLKAMHLLNDTEVVQDAVEGQTNLHEVMAEVDCSIIDDELIVKGLTATIAELSERKSRIEIRIGRKRAAIEQALQIAERKNIELPTGTLTLKEVPPKVEIYDESKLPARFWKPADPTIDKTGLANALKENAAAARASAAAGTPEPTLEIPGARLGNGGITLQIRRS